MKKTIIEIIIILAISGAIGIIYNLFAENPLPLIRKSQDENVVNINELFDKQKETNITDLDKTVTFEQIKKIMNDPEFVLIDARTEEQYSEGHIGNAININPYFDEAEYIELILSIPPEKTVICYCDGGTCDLSHEVATDMLNFGFTKIYIYAGGWEEWSQNINM